MKILHAGPLSRGETCDAALEHLRLGAADVLWLILTIAFSVMNELFSNLALSINGAIYNAVILATPTFLLRDFNVRRVVTGPRREAYRPYQRHAVLTSGS